MLYIALILFLSSIGSIRLHRAQNKNAMVEFSVLGIVILNIIAFLPLIMVYCIVEELWNLNFFWNILLTVGISLLTALPLAKLYNSFLGIKTSPQMSLMTGTYIRKNIYFADAAITYILGLIIYFIAK